MLRCGIAIGDAGPLTVAFCTEIHISSRYDTAAATHGRDDMTRQIRTHLMFDGTAEAAINHYVDLFPGSTITELAYFDAGDENAGRIRFAAFTLSGREFSCIDSPARHDFGFTPAMSLFVECESTEELETVYTALADGGEVLMPLDHYGFSQRFGWVNDRFGVSWQLNLA